MTVLAIVSFCQTAVSLVSSGSFIHIGLGFAQPNRVSHSLLNMLSIVAPQFNSNVLGGSPSKDLRMDVITFLITLGFGYDLVVVRDSARTSRIDLLWYVVYIIFVA